MLKFEEWQKLDIRIAEIVAAERVAGTDRLLRLVVDLGGEQRQLVAGIGAVYTPEELIGRKIPVFVNLEPKQLKGIDSQGMLLAADDGGKPVLLQPERDVPNGSRIK